MKNLTKTQFVLLSIEIIFFAFLLFGITWNTPFINDVYNQNIHEVTFGGLHACFNILIALFIIGYIIFFCICMENDNFKDEDDDETKSETINMKKIKKYTIWFIVIVVLYNMFSGSFSQLKFMYNTSKMYHNAYTQKVQEKEGFYDKLWKTYLQKEKITNVNKETFIQVTKIIMENRKDGDKIMWKWIHENQQIPYDEFTKFYSDLSQFIAQQREGYFNIEKECQDIAYHNNTLLDTFPNNMYNKVLGCQPIKFEYGFTSDSTQTIFKNKKESIK